MRKANFLKKLCMLSMAAVLVGTSVDASMMEVQAASKKVTLTASKKTIVTGQSFTLKVKSVKGLKNKKVKFKSSNSKVAKVAKSGAVTSVKITGKKAGTATITATSAADKKVKATCKVTVKQGVSKITLNAKKATLGYKKSMQLVADISPATASNKVTWKSANKKIATVSSKGKVTAKKKAGKVKITATAKDGSGKKATCTITVKKKVTAVKSVTLSTAAHTMNVGNTYTLKATVAPSKASNKNVYWTTSNKAVAAVDQKGQITALKAGTATITATANDGSKKKATCTVTVIAPSIALNKTAATIQEGSTLQLIATVRDAGGTGVTWSSSNPAVATVVNGVEAGKVTAVKAGTAIITAKSNSSGLTASCTVTVTAKSVDPKPPVEVKVTGVTLDKEAAEMEIGDTVTLTATVAPSDAANKEVTWSSSNAEVATVENGVVTAVAAGTANITVTTVDGGFTATCKVTVKETEVPEPPVKVEVTGVTLNKTTATLVAGDTVALTATVAPANADNKDVTWTSSNPAVATVENGVVTALVAGTADITVTTVDGGFTATCKVTVEAAQIPAVAITLDKEELKIPAGTIDLQTKLVATVTPAESTDAVVWTSDSEVITVAEDGTVLVPAGTEAGTRAVITATAGEMSASCNVLVTGAANAILEQEDRVYYMLDKTASSVSATRKDISVTKTMAEVEEKIDEAKDYAEGILSGSYTATELIDKAWEKLVTRSSNGITMTVTAVDANTKRVTVEGKGKLKTAVVTKGVDSIVAIGSNRTITVKDITVGTNEDGTEGTVAFKVDAVVNGKVTVADKEFLATVTVSDEGYYSGALYEGSVKDDDAVIAACEETENDIVAVIDVETANKAIADLGSGRTVSSLLEEVSVNNIYE